MTQRLFFSWQADTPNAVGRNFLRAVLEDICKEISTDTSLDEAARDVRVDSDTQGVAGQPPIAETIFAKIDDAAVFIADMTFTGKRLDGRPTPNPNVLIEYGWALKALRHSRVITVMNAAYGEPSADDLPFDLAHLRWPTQYNLPIDAEPTTKAEQKLRFKRALRDALKASLAMVPLPIISSPLDFKGVAPRDGPARFRSRGEALGFDEDLTSGANSEVFLKSGPAMWLRLMPAVDPQKRWPVKELLRIGSEDSALFPLRNSAGGYSHVRASDGQGIYRVEPSKRRSTDTVAFAFRTGEVWSVDAAFLALDASRLYYSDIENVFTEAAERYRRFLKGLGIGGPYRWRAGLVGVKGRHLGYPPRPGYVREGYSGPICAADQIESVGSITEEQGTLEALLPFFEQIFEECGIERPDHLAKQ